MLLAAAGLARLRPAWLLAAAVLLAVGLSTRTTVACLPDCKVRHDDWRGAAAYVERRARPGDALVFDPGELRTPFAHYLGAGTAPALLYPDRWALAGGPAAGARTVAGALDRAARYRRVWLVTWWLPEGRVPAALAEDFRQARSLDFAGDVRVRLFERRRA